MASYGEPWRTIRTHIASIVLHFVGSTYRHSRQPAQSNPDQALPVQSTAILFEHYGKVSSQCKPIQAKLCQRHEL